MDSQEIKKGPDSYLRIQDEQNISLPRIDASKIEPEEIQTKEKKKSSFRRLFKYTLKHKFLLVAANFGLLITSLSLVLLPGLTGQIIDTISKGGDRKKLNQLSLEFIGVFALAAIFGFIRGSSYNLIGEKVLIQIRNELFSKLLEKDIAFYDQNRSGELVSRITSDITLIQSAASDTISILLRNLIQFIGSLFLLWFISWKLTLLLLCVIPPFLITVLVFAKHTLFIQYFNRYYKKYTKEYQDLIAKSTQVATETLGNMRVVRSFSTEDKERYHFGRETEGAYIIGRKRAFLYGMFSGIGMVLAFGVILAILWYGGSLVLNGDLSVGKLSSFVIYTLTMTMSVLAVSGLTNNLIQATTVAEKVFELMDHPVTIQSGNHQQLQFEGKVEFVEVDFSYPSKSQVSVLSDISFVIQPGEVVAFVGQSGSGKSTIVSLLERFYDPNHGEIYFDGINLKQYDIRNLHQQIGFVSQEPTLFSGTLEENITYGVQNYTLEQIEKSMKLANAYEFVQNINTFPEGLKTIVGERGVKLSGGQKQRIAIARALIKDPKILIFDEATSALDAESEFQVQQAIDGLVQSSSKTIILIAHRLSTIINSHKIVVLQNGKITEIGNHQELIRKNGVYKQLIERQLSSCNQEEQLKTSSDSDL